MMLQYWDLDWTKRPTFSDIRFFLKMKFLKSKFSSSCDDIREEMQVETLSIDDIR